MINIFKYAFLLQFTLTPPSLFITAAFFTSDRLSHPSRRQPECQTCSTLRGQPRDEGQVSSRQQWGMSGSAREFGKVKRECVQKTSDALRRRWSRRVKLQNSPGLGRKAGEKRGHNLLFSQERISRFDLGGAELDDGLVSQVLWSRRHMVTYD